MQHQEIYSRYVFESLQMLRFQEATVIQPRAIKLASFKASDYPSHTIQLSVCVKIIP